MLVILEMVGFAVLLWCLFIGANTIRKHFMSNKRDD